MAPARAIQCISRPPSSAFSGLASFGNTISVISEIESRTGRERPNFAFSSLFIDRQIHPSPSSSNKNSALPGAITLEVAGRESYHPRVGMSTNPNLAHQVEDQFAMFNRSVI